MPLSATIANARRHVNGASTHILATLDTADRPLSSDEIAAETGLSRDYINRTLGELADAGLAAYTRAPGDHRRRLWQSVR